MTAPAKGYLPTLDGWRAIAILMVCVAHATDALFAPGAPHANALLEQLTRYGAKGVDVFFGISGFLICSRLLEEYQERGRISLKGFYIRRFARILPPYFLYLGCLALLSVTGVLVLARGELLSSLFFLRNYWNTPINQGWYTGHLWSLAVEEHFYLLLPGLLVLWSPPKALPRIVLLALAVQVWRTIEFRYLLLTPHLGAGVGYFTRTDTRLDALLWGCVLALVMARPEWRQRLANGLTRPAWIMALIALVADFLLTPPLALFWQALLIPVVFAYTVLNPDTAAGRLLETKPARWIGRTSYSLYLWQSMFFVAWGFARPLGAVQRLPLSVIAVLACATASYYLVERPFIRLGHRLAPPTTEGRA